MDPKLRIDANMERQVEPREELRERADKIIKKLDAIREEVEEMKNLI